MDSAFSLSTNPKAERKPFARVKPSASVEASISTAQHRVRNANIGSKTGHDETRDLENNAPTTMATAIFNWLFASSVSSDAYSLRQRLIHNSRLRCFLALYCVFSLAFLSFALYSQSPFDYSPSLTNSAPPAIIRSPLQDLPNQHLMSKLSSLYPSPLELLPFAIQAESGDGQVTACMWSPDEDLNFLPIWASRWKDPISLLVVTRHQGSSPESKILMAKLQEMRNLSSVKSRVSVHVLYLPTQSPENPNAFLNLARVFSTTPTVILFPARLSLAPPKTFHRSVASVVQSPKPVVFSMRQHTAFPFAALSPVVLSREDPLWCTERFFPPMSRSADWAECLWQVWLENFGDVEIKTTTDWVHESRQVINATVAEARVRRRLASKFRTETCVLATRQLAALRTPEHRVDTKKARWLKRNCREWTAAGRDS